MDPSLYCKYRMVISDRWSFGEIALSHLSLVQAIVRRHGGEIKVSSSPGVGSTFEVVLLQTSAS